MFIVFFSRETVFTHIFFTYLYHKSVMEILILIFKIAKDRGRGRSRLHAGSWMWDSIPQPWVHDLSQRQMGNR